LCHPSGAVLGKTWPDGDTTGTAASPWTYDEAGRLFGIPGLVTSTLYNAAGQVTEAVYSNGVRTTNTYNAYRLWLEAIETKNAANTVIHSVVYGRDAAGRIGALTAGPAGGFGET